MDQDIFQAMTILSQLSPCRQQLGDLLTQLQVVKCGKCTSYDGQNTKYGNTREKNQGDVERKGYIFSSFCSLTHPFDKYLLSTYSARNRPRGDLGAVKQETQGAGWGSRVWTPVSGALHQGLSQSLVPKVLGRKKLL